MQDLIYCSPELLKSPNNQAISKSCENEKKRIVNKIMNNCNRKLNRFSKVFHGFQETSLNSLFTNANQILNIKYFSKVLINNLKQHLKCISQISLFVNLIFNCLKYMNEREKERQIQQTIEQIRQIIFKIN
ncbi:hypothetical protein ABPG74_017127 [Tetrahymena malaccensis]